MKLSIVISQGPVGVHLDELESLDEGMSLLETNKAKLQQMLGLLGTEAAEVQAQQEVPAEPPKTRKPRSGKDPATASAPPPAPVPDPYLKGIQERTTAVPGVPAPVAPPPPPLAVAPPSAPAAPAAPPTNELAMKVVAEVRKRGASDGGAAILDWLVASSGGIVIKGATFEEALSVLEWTKADKLAGIAGALGVS